jgi:RNA polymerase sigma factor (sigma-70 family)
MSKMVGRKNFAFRLSPFAFRLSPFAQRRRRQSKMESEDDDRGEPGQDSANRSADQSSRRRDEIALVVGCLLGERDAFNGLIRRYAQLVHAVAVEVLRNAHKDVTADADDITQELFEDVWRSPWEVLGNFDASRGGLATYLRTVANRRFTKRLQSHEISWPVRHPRHDEATLEHLPAHTTTQFDAEKLVNRLLKTLSDRSRGIIRARFGLGSDPVPVSVAEIAKKVGLSRSQVHRLIARVLRRSRRVGGPTDESDPAD